MTLRTDRPPAFLGIGAARAGTTWLHAQLRRHPQLWLPPLKELHYWDVQRPGAARYYPIPDHSMLQLRLYWAWKHLRAVLFAGRKLGVTPGWAARYLFGWRSDRWYARLFPTDRVAGEITPGYMLLPTPVLEAMRELNPDLKAILLLRDPVSRAWSNTCHLMRPRTATAPIERFRTLVESQGMTQRGDYVRAIRNWRTVFGAERLFLGYYDDLVSDPRGLLRRVLEFLEVDAGDEHLPTEIEREVNASAKREMPDDIRRDLSRRYLPQLRELDEMLGGHVTRWRAKAEAAAEERSPTG